MRDAIMTRITAAAIDANEALRFVEDERAGGTCVFVGTVRDHSSAGTVTGLTYEAWEEIAVRRLDEIAEELFAKWPVCKAAIVHRTGDLDVGEASVIIACSSAHRADAFEACRHAIERLKEDVPIWKKEHLAAGESQWVMGS